MGSGRSRWSALAGIAGWVAASAATADMPPEPPLQLSRELTPPWPATAAREGERTLLRLKLRASQSGDDGAAAVQELIARLERLDHVVADLQEGMLTAPAPPVAPPAAATHTTGAAGLPWLAAGGTGLLALLGGFWLGRRHRRSEAPPPWETLAASTVTQPMSRVMPMHGSRAGAATPTAVALPEGPSAADDADSDLSLELADVMLSMGLNQGAAQALESHIRAHPRETLYHWLKLLDIYRHAGAREEFARAVEELPQHFNVSPPDWLPEPRGAGPASLESYPHISARIRELWPTGACADYLARLLEDNRGGTRTGFPESVAEEILLLLAILRR